MKISRTFDAIACESLNTVTKVLIELQLNDFLEAVTSSSSTDAKEDTAA